MAKRSFITDFEGDVIRIGHANGISHQMIGDFLGRNRVTVWNHVNKMEKDNTLDNLPVSFVSDEIAAAIRDRCERIKREKAGGSGRAQ